MNLETTDFASSTVWWAFNPECDADTLVSVAKRAREFATASRVLLVSGDVTIRSEGAYDSVGAVAAAVIRLRIDQWLGVGYGVKALSRQVGLEGSWDGESLWCESAADAYDYLRVWPNPGDLIVLTGRDGGEISELRRLVQEATQ